MTLGHHRYFIPAGKDILVTRDIITERHNQPNDHLFTVKFYPGGLENILGIDQSKMAGKLVSLQDVVPADFILQIKKAKNFEERIRLFEDFSLLRMKTQKPRAHYTELVKQTIATYTDGNMQYNVDELSARLFTTSKTINRYFTRIIGTTPKSFLSIIRSREALTAFIENKTTFDPSRFGYYDMSHFYKDAVRFTGKGIVVRNP